MKQIFSLFTIFLLIFSGESFAKVKKKSVNKYLNITIPSENFLQINLLQKDCDRFVDGECFRLDHARLEPYYHETRITIFRNRIFAEQFFQSEDGEDANKRFLPVKDGSYKVIRLNQNLISFDVKNGQISNLKLLQGDVAKEKGVQSECDTTSAIYGFYQAYKKSLIVDQSGFFKDEYNFDGLKEFFTFVEILSPEKLMAMTKNPNQAAVAVEEIRLCKMPNSENYLVRHFSADECKTSTKDNFVECSKYSSCEDVLSVKNCKIVDLQSEEVVQEVVEKAEEILPQKEKAVEKLPSPDSSVKEKAIKEKMLEKPQDSNAEKLPEPQVEEVQLK